MPRTRRTDLHRSLLVALFATLPACTGEIGAPWGTPGDDDGGAIRPGDASLVSDGGVLPGRDGGGGGSDAGLYEHYEQEVKGGDGAFTIEARGFDDFARALRQKLVLEIAYAFP